MCAIRRLFRVHSRFAEINKTVQFVNPMAIRVLASFNNPAGDHCVDVFVRDDGTFGYEEYRRDHEDMKGWFPLNRYAHRIFATDGDALAQARVVVAWMAEERTQR